MYKYNNRNARQMSKVPLGENIVHEPVCEIQIISRTVPRCMDSNDKNSRCYSLPCGYSMEDVFRLVIFSSIFNALFRSLCTQIVTCNNFTLRIPLMTPCIRFHSQ